jgi:hypothetical protein
MKMFYVTSYLGRALTSQKIVPGNTPTGIAPFVYEYKEQLITFTGGGPTVIAIGTVIYGATSHVTGIVVSTPVLTGGTFGGSDAAGSFRIKSSTGTWTSGEKLTVAATADDGDMTGLPVDCADNYLYKGMTARAAMVSVSGNTALMSETSTPDQTYLMGHSMTVPSSYILYDIGDIMAVRFVDYASGSASVINVTCRF